MKLGISFSGFLLGALLVITVSAQNPPLNRAKALRGLKGCAQRPIAPTCSEETAEYLIGLYNHGDRAVLRPLVNAGSYSDGALSEVLGDFYATVLWKRPRIFVGTLSSRSLTDQRTDCMLAAEMRNDQLADVSRSLKRISSERSGHLSAVARNCLAEINRANASSRR